MIASKSPKESKKTPEVSPWTDTWHSSKLSAAKPASNGSADLRGKDRASRLLRLLFVPFWFAGIVESPSAVWSGKSGMMFKVYACGLSALNLLSCFRNLYYIFQCNDDPLLAILAPKLVFYCRLMYGIVTLKSLACRLVCFTIFNFEHRKIASAYSEVASK